MADDKKHGTCGHWPHQRNLAFEKSRQAHGLPGYSFGRGRLVLYEIKSSVAENMGDKK
jgi:hypothetical protein